MSNQSMSASDQVSISHDPLEEHFSAGVDQQRFARDNWPSGGARPTQGSSMRSALDASDLRPALLAGAIGLFAAWLVSGVKSPRASRRQREPGARQLGARYVADREEPGRPQSHFQPVRGPAASYATGPEGSSREDLSLDAMNP